MGKFSRSKGIRGELRFRDAAISMGYTARRVPLSGSQEGYKGDVVFEKGGKSFTAEVKCRKCSFQTIYKYVGITNYKTHGVILDAREVDVRVAVIGINLDEVLAYDDVYMSTPDAPFFKKTIGKLNTLHKLLGSADLLVLKDDRFSFIYVKYY